MNRRHFIKKSASAIGIAFGAPYFVPVSLSGKTAPSNRITIGCIGVGRMGFGNLRDILRFDEVQVTAVCDVDSWRLENARTHVEKHYAEKSKTGNYQGCTEYNDFRNLLARPDIDAVMICTPDHWHALPAIQAAQAGKDIFIEKPLTLTIHEGRILSDTVKRYNRILQVGSQQRSDARFRFAAELVRNGKIGQLHTVRVGFDKDPFTGPFPQAPVPEELDYEMWLGPAPDAPYIEQRVHPPKSYDRPGWLRVEAYCCGMMTGWGSHHIDSAHWGMDMDYGGPVEIEGRGEYSRDGIWDVHGAFNIDYKYSNGVRISCMDTARNKSGVVFEGTEGWVYVDRGWIDANPKSLLSTPTAPNEINLYNSTDHKRNFLDCIRSRKESIASVEIAHRSASACILGYLAMKLQRKLYWNPEKEQFVNDDVANKLLSRPYRSPWEI